MKKKITGYIKPYLDILWEKLPSTLIIGFFFFYFFEGMAYTVGVDLITQIDVILKTDPNPRIRDMLRHTGVFRHPYYAFSFEPFLWIVNFFISDLLISIHVVQSVLAALSVYLLFKSCLMLSNSKKIALALSLVYGFSFSQLIFASIPESFIISGFFLNLAFYCFIRFLKDKKDRIGLLALITALAFGVTILNGLVIGLMFIFYLCAKKKETWKAVAGKTVKFGALTGVLITAFIMIYNGFDYKSVVKRYNPLEGINKSKIWFHIGGGYYEIRDNKTIKKTRSEKAFFEHNIMSFYRFTITSWNTGHELDPSDEKASFSEVDGVVRPMVSTVFFGVFLVLWIHGGLLVRKLGSMQEKKMYLGLTTILLLNFILFLFWIPVEGFLFSQHHIFLWFLIMAMSIKLILQNAKKMKYDAKSIKKGFVYFFAVFALCEFAMTHSLNKQVIARAYKNYPMMKRIVFINDGKETMECAFHRLTGFGIGNKTTMECKPYEKKSANPKIKKKGV